MPKRFQDENPDFEIEFYEKILEKRPGFVEALGALGDLYARRGFYQKSLEIDHKLSHLKPADPVVLYNLACSYSLLNDTDKALRTIQKAVACGYDDFSHLERDTDLENLRRDSRFQQYFSQVKSGRTSVKPDSSQNP